MEIAKMLKCKNENINLYKKEANSNKKKENNRKIVKLMLENIKIGAKVKYGQILPRCSSSKHTNIESVKI